MKNNNSKNNLYHYNNDKKGKDYLNDNEYDSEFAIEDDFYDNHQLNLQVQQDRVLSKENTKKQPSKSKKGKTAK